VQSSSQVVTINKPTGKCTGQTETESHHINKPTGKCTGQTETESSSICETHHQRQHSQAAGAATLRIAVSLVKMASIVMCYFFGVRESEG